MARKGRLLAALDAHKGRNYKVEKQKKVHKEALKRKRLRLGEFNGADQTPASNGDAAEEEDWESDEQPDLTEVQGQKPKKQPGKSILKAQAETSSDSELGEEEEHEEADLEEEGDDQDSESIAMSDIESLGSEDREDIIPHQRLTINNTTALLKAYEEISLGPNLPFSAFQSVTASTQTEIADVHDDLTRELALYKQCLDAVTEARASLIREGVPFSRPADYFAEMVKTDEHMGKIKAKMVEDASNKKAAAEARKQRDLKKFGKQVQIAKLQERDRAKRDTLNRITALKRKRKDGDLNSHNEPDLFDVTLDNSIKPEDARGRAGSRGAKGSREKRAKKDAKFGFGGKKRFSKSGDAISTGDMRGFSAQKMKGKKPTKRLGKSKRSKFSG